MTRIPVKSRAARRAAAVLLVGPAALAPAFGSEASAAPSAGALAFRNIPVCGAPAGGTAACDVVLHQRLLGDGAPAPSLDAPPSGALAPQDILEAYNWTGLAASTGPGAGETIGIVDAYDDPTIASDLDTFSARYGLPAIGGRGTNDLCSSPFAFTKVNQAGSTSASDMPARNAGWALEISLDVEWAHAIAPCADITLVEANSSTLDNLGSAENTAVDKGARYVSNSWGGGEVSGETTDDTEYFGSGATVSYFAASGDSGGVVNYPASSPNVVAVGGTTLSATATSAGTLWSETAWSGSGGGCSRVEAATPTQSPFSLALCPGGSGTLGMRATPDVAADADPNTGVAVYDSTRYQGQSGWFQVGGTSLSTPIWAARAADQAVHVDSAELYAGGTAAYPDDGTALTYRDVLVGSNGYPALPGDDLTTGLGSWASGATASAAPDAPVLAAPTLDTGSVTLSWSEDRAGVTFNVYRSTSSDMAGARELSCSGTTATTCTDSGLASGTYDYAVTAVDSGGVLSRPALSGPLAVTGSHNKGGGHHGKP